MSPPKIYAGKKAARRNLYRAGGAANGFRFDWLLQTMASGAIFISL
jgi:hypothetical protein